MTKTLSKINSTEPTTITEKLFITNFKPNTESHIKVNSSYCSMCPGKECTRFCPSGVFAWSKIDDGLIVAYENCVECGACNLGCPFKAIEYSHPEASYGIF